MRAHTEIYVGVRRDEIRKYPGTGASLLKLMTLKRGVLHFKEGSKQAAVCIHSVCHYTALQSEPLLVPEAVSAECHIPSPGRAGASVDLWSGESQVRSQA